MSGILSYDAVVACFRVASPLVESDEPPPYSGSRRAMFTADTVPRPSVGILVLEYDAGAFLMLCRHKEYTAIDYARPQIIDFVNRNGLQLLLWYTFRAGWWDSWRSFEYWRLRGASDDFCRSAMSTDASAEVMRQNIRHASKYCKGPVVRLVGGPLIPGAKTESTPLEVEVYLPEDYGAGLGYEFDPVRKTGRCWYERKSHSTELGLETVNIMCPENPCVLGILALAVQLRTDPGNLLMHSVQFPSTLRAELRNARPALLQLSKRLTGSPMTFELWARAWLYDAVRRRA